MADQPLRAGLQRELGFHYASDTRVPGRLRRCSTTAPPRFRSCRLPLPTLDELIGRAELRGVDPVDHVLAVTAAVPARDHVSHCTPSSRAARICLRSSGCCAPGSSAVRA